MARATKKDAAVEKAAEVKEEVKAAAEKGAEKVKETAARAKKTTKAAAAKTKEAAAKTKEAVEKVVEKDAVFVEYGDKQVDVAAVIEAAKADYKNKGHRVPKAVTIYVKPEDGVAYYTVSGKGAEDQKVEL